MKKFLFSTIILSAVALQAQAQLKLGIKGGLNLTFIHTVYNGQTSNGSGTDFKNKVGYHAGFMAQLPIIGKISLQAEALYNTKGGKIENQTSDNTGPALGYFSVPALAVYKPGPKFGIEGGVEFGTLLSARQKSGGNDRDITGEFEGNEIGLVGGIQFQVTENINFDARYTYGLTPSRQIDLIGLDGTSGSVKNYNRAIQVSLAYMFLK